MTIFKAMTGSIIVVAAMAMLASPLAAEPGGPANNRGNQHFFKREFDRAIVEFNEAIRLGWGSTTSRGRAYLANGDYDRAIEDFDESIRRQSKPFGTVMPLYFRGMAYHQKGDYDRAIQDYDEAIRRSAGAEYSVSGVDYPLYGRGLAKLKKGDEAGGRADIAAAIAASKKMKYPSDVKWDYAFYGLSAER